MTGGPADELREAEPRVDRLDMAQARARAEQLLFGTASPAKLGRYVLLARSGDGGMGVVYAAYDPELHRKVALKVLHPRQQHDRAHERLITEARALAKLDHPNVVKVHDVLTHHDQVVLVMEWVEGNTLATWERVEPRSWRALLAVYTQAAQGLAAAHGVGVIHRDFKPTNAIVGVDGRVRVLDFGLASSAATSTDTEPSTASASLAAGSVDDTWPAGLTATGAMVGTLAYAPPEQLEGIAASPASDQFSFAVSLHRAIEGVPPFSGDDVSSRCAAIRSGSIHLAIDRRQVPAWLRAAIARSLAASPADRFPSMPGLIATLSRPRGWRRWRAPAAMAGVVIVAVVAILAPRGASDPLAACDGGIGEISPIWSPSARDQLRTALGHITIAGIDEVSDRVLRGLDAYSRRWTELHRDACVAHRRGEQSESLLDRRMLCLEKRLVDLQSAISVLAQVNASSANKAVDVVAGIPAIDECADSERLQAQTPPPPPAVQQRVARVRASLSQAAALDRAGRNAEATTLVISVTAEAERSEYAPLLAEALLLRGRLLLAARNMELATTVFAQTLELALRHHQLAIAVEAGARKLYVEGMLRADVPALKRDVAFLLPLSMGLPDDHFVRPLLLNNVGVVYIAAGDRAQALHHFQQAHDALAGLRQIDPELINIDDNLARLTIDPASRESLARDTWTRLRAVFGDANIATLDALTLYARLTDIPSQALPLLARACNSYAELHHELVEARTYCESYRAFLLEQLGRPSEALRVYDGIVALGHGSDDEAVHSYAVLASGSAALIRGDVDGAARAWQDVVDRDGRSPYWWVRVRSAHAELGLGAVARTRHRDAEAARYFEGAIRSYSDAIAVSEETEYRMRRDLAEAGLTQVRRAARAGSPEIRERDAAPRH